MLNTQIAWCDHTINWWWGCSKVSRACEHCYAEGMDARFHADDPHWGPNAPRLLRVPNALEELARIRRRAIKTGERPRVFINSMSDFFEDRRDLDAARLVALHLMQQAPEVDFLLLTKRPENIKELIWRAMDDLAAKEKGDSLPLHWLLAWFKGFPPPNVWLGTTAENQEWADKRIPELLKVPAAVRFLSIEPMLGPIDLGFLEACDHSRQSHADVGCWRAIDWVICGGESGPHARPMHPEWARSLRDQCAAAGVPFFFKQWGEHAPIDQPWKQNNPADLGHNEQWLNLAGGQGFHGEQVWRMRRIGKEAAGRLLDGVEHSAFPEVAP